MSSAKITNASFRLFSVCACILLLTAFTKATHDIKQTPSSNGLQTTVLVKDTVPEPEDVTFEKVEIEAYYPGGDEAWISFLQQNLNASVPVAKGAPEGKYTVFIQFIVDVNGKLSAFKPLTKHGYGMEAEVMRILRKSPSWVPAIQDGKKVKAYRKQPVTFQVEVEKKKKRGS